MIYKQRTKPLNLWVMESLYYRMGLTEKNNYYYSNLDKGFPGEVWLDSLSEKAPGERLLLGDLLLKAGGKTRQIDALIITSKAALLYEVKNFEGEYVYKNDRIYRVGSDKPLWNPFNQLEEADTLLHQLFAEHQIQLPIQSYVVFINPKMTLYQAPVNPSLLLASNLDKHFEETGKNLNRLSSQHRAIANKLCELCLPETLYPGIPEYTYEGLRKGVLCAGCGSFINEITPRKGKYCCCKRCGRKELVSETLDRLIDEYMRLFPGRAISTANIYDWCGGVFTFDRIRAHLSKRFKKQGSNRRTIYF